MMIMVLGFYGFGTLSFVLGVLCVCGILRIDMGRVCCEFSLKMRRKGFEWWRFFWQDFL